MCAQSTGAANAGAVNRTVLVRAWARPGLALAGAGAVSALAGLLLAWYVPRGPLTGTELVVVMVGTLLLGLGCGVVSASRWSMLVVPLAVAVAFELGRIGVIGPTVDRPRFDVSLGVVAFLFGRVLLVPLMLAPALIGAAFGAGTARRLQQRAAPTGVRHGLLVARRVVTAGTGVLLILLMLALLQPGSTPSIRDANGDVVEGSVAELATVPLGGHDQNVLIRGRDRDDPVLLYLAGGPGQSDVGYTRAYMTELPDDLVFAVWDQRGSGNSYPALDPAETWTLDQAVADTVELAEHLRERFDEEKIYLFGNSWGSTLGVLAVQQRPDLFHAFVGAGQMVSQLDTDTRIYEQFVALAERNDDDAMRKKLADFGPPPYADVYGNAYFIEHYDDLEPYEKTDYFETQGPSGLDGNGVSEYGGIDKVNKIKGLLDMGRVMYPQLQDLDFREQVRSIDVPVYLVQGAHELTARSEFAREWFDLLDAPSKKWITFERSGHIPQFEEFDRFRDVMADIVDETYPSAPASR